MVHRLLRFLGLHDASLDERRATLWVGAMFFFALSSTFLLRPLRDQFGVDEGVMGLEKLYSLTLLATVVAVLPFWWLANRMSSRRFVPIVLHTCAAGFVLLAIGLNAIGDYDWSRLPWLGGTFWGGYSAVNVIVPTMVWIHAVEHFRTDQARRLFGLVAVGGTLGAVFGSWAAGFLTQTVHAPLWVSGASSAALLELAFVAFLVSFGACRRMRDAGGVAAGERPAAASGGVLEGLRVLARDGYVRRIGVYMMLLGILATSFYAAQTELVGAQIKAGRAQHYWLAEVEKNGQGLVLLLQLFATGQLMRRVPGVLLLISLPLVSIVGLGTWWLWPSAFAIFFIQIGRRGTQYALEKPAREVLYTPLDLATKHKVKFLLDTFAFRLGDLLGAVLQLQLRDWKLSTGGIVLVTMGVALVWIVLGLSLGRRAGEAQPVPTS